jgi:hypothetical protein
MDRPAASRDRDSTRVSARRYFENVAEIGCERYFDTLRGNGVTHRIHRIVRNREARHIQIADCEAASGLKGFEMRRRFSPIKTRRGALSEINRQTSARTPDKSSQAIGVISMLMREQNSIEVRNIFANVRQSPSELTPADSGVDEYACSLGCQENRIADAAACENADLKNGRLPAAAKRVPKADSRCNCL